MFGIVIASTGLVALLAGAVQYMTRVARGDLRPPPTALRVGVVAGAALSGVGFATGVALGEPTAPLVAVSVLGGAFSGFALWIHSRRRVPLGTLRVAVGDAPPDFEALTPDGQRFHSRSLQGRRVLLKFFRGEWCPFCQAELRRFDALGPTLAAAGIEVVAISKDTPEAARRHRDRDQLRLSLLCDPDLRVIRQFGVEHRKALEISDGPRIRLFGLAIGTRPAFRSMAAPTTLLVDEAGVVRWLDQTDDYKVRSSAERVLGAVSEALGLQTAWDAPTEREGAPAPEECCLTC